MSDCSSESDQDLIAELVETVVVLRTRAVTRQVLLAFCQMTISERKDVDDFQQLFAKFTSEPQGGMNFILKIDNPLQSAWESNKDVITETFLKEIDEFTEFFNPEKKESSEENAKLRKDFSRLYGKDSAWN